MEYLCNTSVQDLNGSTHRLTKLAASGQGWCLFRTDSGDLARVLEISDSAGYEITKDRLDWIVRVGGDEGILRPRRVLNLDLPLLGYTFSPVLGAQKLSRWLSRDSASPFLLSVRLRVAIALAQTIAKFNKLGLGIDGINPDDILVKELDDRSFEVWFTKVERLVRPGSVLRPEKSPAYGAPEVNLGTHHPDALSNNFSLATIIFEVLRLAHPFGGSNCLALQAEDSGGGMLAVPPYVDEPGQPKHSRSKSLTPCTGTPILRSLFQRAFTAGVRYRNRRPTPEEFVHACILAETQAMTCLDCKNEFYGVGIGAQPCAWCDTLIMGTPQLAFFDVVHRGGTGSRKMSNRKLRDRHIYMRPGRNRILNAHLSDILGDAEKLCFSIDWASGKFTLHNHALSGMRVMLGASKSFQTIPIGGELEIRAGYQLYPAPASATLEVTSMFGEPATCRRVCRLIVGPGL